MIGGSVLRGAIAAGWTGWAYNRSAVGADAARAEGYDADTDLARVLRRAADSDALIVLGVPMPAMDDVLAAVAAHAPDAALTDVVSVQGPLRPLVARHGLSRRYVGSHPMAGSAASGWAASTAELFTDAAWVVGCDDGADPAVWTRVARLALECGAVVVPAGSAEHDAAVARISHLPHLLAEALALAGAAGGDLALGLAAGSFRDGTRVAGSAPALVRAMCEANADALLPTLDEALQVLTDARDMLARDRSTAGLVEAGHAARQRYEQQQPWTISGIEPSDPDWLERLREAGRRGGVLRAW
ncbi:prephenate dehydrogenase [Skermania piniformis]